MFVFNRIPLRLISMTLVFEVVRISVLNGLNHEVLAVISSPDPKAQVSFSDQNFSIVRRRCRRQRRCRCCCHKLFTFSSSSPEPLG